MDREKIREAVKMILEAIGEDPCREGLLETPDRIANMYQEIFSGSKEEAALHLKKTFTIEENHIVVEKNIAFYSMCEHHLLPFWGKAHIAYLPNGQVAGLSKLARTVEVYARRAQIQERLSLEIAGAIMENLKAQGVLVVIEAEHMCMNMRGVEKPGTSTVSMVAKGIFDKDKDMKEEALRLIGYR